MTARSRQRLALVLGVAVLVGALRALDPTGVPPPVQSEVVVDPTTASTSAPTGTTPTTALTGTPTTAPPPESTTPTAPTGTRTTAPTTAPATPPTALTAAHLLRVQGRAPRTGYDRELFGQRWADVDRNGCDTRNDILRRDLAHQVLKEGTHGCVVASGTLDDPYSGETVAFVRGQGTSTAVQIDHVVALADAWQKGAQQWDAVTREAFANDPLNLLAVDGPSNQQKGAGDTATWLPPHKPFRCAYVARQVAVKRAYGLGVTQAEQDAMVRVLSACPTEPLPS